MHFTEFAYSDFDIGMTLYSRFVVCCVDGGGGGGADYLNYQIIF